MSRVGGRVLQGSYLDCAAPALPQSASGRNVTVLLQLLLQTPVAAAVDAWKGIGNPAVSIVGGQALTTLDVSVVYPYSAINGSSRTATSQQQLRRESVSTTNWRSTVYGDKLMFTYTVNGERCGCDMEPSTVCDACGTHLRCVVVVTRFPFAWMPRICIPVVVVVAGVFLGPRANDACAGVCGGANSTRDCAGQCFGPAVIDDCDYCTGGVTGRVYNSCDEECFVNTARCTGQRASLPHAGWGGGGLCSEVVSLSCRCVVASVA